MAADWITSLAATGGNALLAAAATDAWQTARDGVVRLFGCGGRRRRDLAAKWLDEDAAAVARTDPTERDQVRQQLIPAWQIRLADLLREYPDVEGELRTWANRVQERLPAQQKAWIQNISASAPGAIAQGAFGNIYNYDVTTQAGSTTTDTGVANGMPDDER